MILLTLDLMKAQLRIDGTDEDTLLNMYGEAAEQMLQNYCERSFDELYTEFGETWVQPLTQAALMLVTLSYEHRSPVTQTNLYNVPYTFDALVMPYMKL